MLERCLDVGVVRISHGLLQQVHENTLRRVCAPALEHDGARKEIALKQLEAELAAVCCALLALDFLRQQLHVASLAGFVHELRKLCCVGLQHVYLDDIDERQDRCMRLVELHDVVEREREPSRAQIAAALDHGLRDFDRFEQLDDGALGRQQLHGIGHQQLRVEIDEASAVAEDRCDAEVVERVCDHAGRGHTVVRDPARSLSAGAKQQLVGDRVAREVENRLATQPERRVRSHRPIVPAGGSHGFDAAHASLSQPADLARRGRIWQATAMSSIDSESGGGRARSWLSVAAVAVLGGLAVLGGWRTTGGAAPRRANADDGSTNAAEGYEQTDSFFVDDGAALRYEKEYPTIGYTTAPLDDPISKLEKRLARGEAKLTFVPGRGYLDSLLAALDIDPSSQTLVFSQTSLQSRRIRPRTPRAIYFNDDVYVAWVQHGPLEIGSLDPHLGPVFYIVEQNPAAAPEFGRQLKRCLSCHDSYSLSGGGVPRFIVGSGYVGPEGNLVTHEGWILVTDRTPLESRWGGWYVTGHSGSQVHLGNMIIRSYADFDHLQDLRAGNIDTLDGLFDTKPYLTDKSDIVALMVLEHQVNAQNAITRVNYDTRTVLDAEHAEVGAADAAPSATAMKLIDDSIEPLVETMLFVGAVELTSPLSGLPAFQAQFEKRAVRDDEGRSLRDLDLETRLFRYPLSYTIYSDAFAALPDVVKTAVYRRIASVLDGEEQSEKFADLSAADRRAIKEILMATKPDFVAATAGE